MPDSTSLVQLVKHAAVEAVLAGAPVQGLYGTVLSASPLQISVEQKLILDEDHLVLCRGVTDYDIDMIVDHQTEPAAGGEGLAEYAAHLHGYKGQKTFRVLGALKQGERVVLLRVQGGQKYIVIDRVGGG